MTRKRAAIRNAETVSETAQALLNAEQVCARAYEIYCERLEDGRAGDALTDWVTAERELMKDERA